MYGCGELTQPGDELIVIETEGFFTHRFLFFFGQIFAAQILCCCRTKVEGRHASHEKQCSSPLGPFGKVSN